MIIDFLTEWIPIAYQLLGIWFVIKFHKRIFDAFVGIDGRLSIDEVGKGVIMGLAIWATTKQVEWELLLILMGGLFSITGLPYAKDIFTIKKSNTVEK